MEYLRGNATASATALFVICRYLSAIDGGQTDEDLQASLEVLRSLNSTRDEASAVFKASLTVGEGLGLVSRSDSRSPWMANMDIAKALRTEGDTWPWFRGELLFRIGSHALKALEEDKKVPDLALGLTWFLQQSPLRPLHLTWGLGPEKALTDIGFEAVSGKAQWRPFGRWALATGLARRCDHRGARVLIPDASTAISDQFAHLPKAANAQEWLSALQARLPIFGVPSLLKELPQGGRDWQALPPGVVIGLLKLERASVLSLEPSDDAADVVAIGFGQANRQVGRISVKGLK